MYTFSFVISNINLQTYVFLLNNVVKWVALYASYSGCLMLKSQPGTTYPNLVFYGFSQSFQANSGIWDLFRLDY